MISPIELAYLPQQDQMAFLDWLGFHARFHQVIAQKAIARGFQNLGTYQFATMGDRDDWLYFHNQEHNEIAQTFNIGAPPDLGYWDENDPGNFNNWLQSHALVHDNERKVIGF